MLLQQLFEFLHAGVTPFHAVAHAASLLDAAGSVIYRQLEHVTIP